MVFLWSRWPVGPVFVFEAGADRTPEFFEKNVCLDGWVGCHGAASGSLSASARDCWAAGLAVERRVRGVLSRALRGLLDGPAGTWRRG